MQEEGQGRNTWIKERAERGETLECYKNNIDRREEVERGGEAKGWLLGRQES